jgi:hypothetical protein
MMDLFDDLLLLQIFKHLSDEDLQVTSQVSTQWRRMSADWVLWRFKHFHSAANMLTRRLDPDVRSSRVELIDRNVMKGIQPHQVSRGFYVATRNQQTLFQVQHTLEKQMKENAIRNTLQRRLSNEDLHHMRVLPKDVSVGAHPEVAQKVVQLQRALLKAKLFSNLTHRHINCDHPSSPSFA